MELKLPHFQIKQWPLSEIEEWAIVFSVRDNNDKPIVKKPEPTLKQAKADFRALMGG